MCCCSCLHLTMSLDAVSMCCAASTGRSSVPTVSQACKNFKSPYQSTNSSPSKPRRINRFQTNCPVCLENNLTNLRNVLMPIKQSIILSINQFVSFKTVSQACNFFLMPINQSINVLIDQSHSNPRKMYYLNTK